MTIKTIGLNIKRAAIENPTIMASLQADTANALKEEMQPNGKPRLRSVVRQMYYAAVIAGGSAGNVQVPLHDTNQAKKIGISSFEQGMKVPSDILIAGVKLEYAVGANNDTVVANKPYTNLAFSRTALALATGLTDVDAGAAGNQGVAVPARTLPVELINTEFVLTVKDTERFRCPLMSLFIENDRKDYMNGDFNDFVSLQEQLILAPKDASVKAFIHTADGINLSNANNHFFKWTIVGSTFDSI